MKKIFIITFLSMVNLLYSQVGINIETPDESSAFEIFSTSKGLLIPRVALKSNKDTNTISSPANSLLVYNTGTSENSVSDNEKVTPGYYYWYKDENTPKNSKWIRLSSGTYTAGEGMTLTNTEFSRNGLQELNSDKSVRTATSTGNYGWRYIGLDQTNYAEIGKYATDLSYAPKNLSNKTGDDFSNLDSSYSTYPYSAVKNLNAELDLGNLGASGKYSFTSGLMNQGKGDYSATLGVANANKAFAAVSLGAFNTTKGIYSFAAGGSNKVNKNYSFALGANNIVSATSSGAMGDSNLLEGSNSLALGTLNKVTNTGKNINASYAIGLGNEIESNSSLAIGSYNGALSITNYSDRVAATKISGIQAVVIGRMNGVTGANGVAIGTWNQVSGTNYGVAIGVGLDVNTDHSVALGSYNTIATNVSDDNFKRVLVVGNEITDNSSLPVSQNSRSDALTILRNGQMGVDIDNFETNYTSDVSKGHIKDVKLQVNGTAQLRTLPKSGENNYLPNKTVVSDDRGVIGYVNGLPTSYNRKTVPIDNSTPTNSATSLGNLAIRLNGTSDSGEQTLQFKLNNNKSHVTIWGEKMGKGYSSGINPYARSSYKTATNTGTWEDTGMGINPKNRDMVRYTFNLHNTKEVYRVSVVSNAHIDANLGVDEVPAQITIFIEKLD